MQILLIAGVALVAVLLEARAVQAAEGPWCAVVSTGTGSVYEDCQYFSFEACRPHVLSGNRGFCNQNPRWAGPPPGKKARSKRKASSG